MTIAEPLVSVVLPVRNGGRYLHEAIGSIQNQSLTDFEFVLLDDGSTDDTAKIIAAHAIEDTRIRAVPVQGRGIIDALNSGLSAARAPFVARMDADDFAEPRRLAQLHAAMEASPDLVLLGSAAVSMDTTGRMGEPLPVEPAPERLAALLRKTNPILHPTIMMRREVVTAAGGYRQAFRYAEDYELWLRLAKVGKLANLPVPLMKLRRHAGQTSRVHRLEQRGATALARLVHFGTTMPPDRLAALDRSENAFADYLALREETRIEAAPDEARDLAVLIRACQSRTPLPRRTLSRYVGMLDGRLSPLARLKLAANLLVRH